MRTPSCLGWPRAGRLRTPLRFVAAGAVATLAACSSLGPSTVPRDRMEYSHSLSQAWQRQTLLNLVKLRYFEPPMFVDVGQVVSGYSVELSTAASLELGLFGPEDILNLGAAGKYTDRPTITYTPLTGARFIRALMTPVRPDSIFTTIQSGFSPEGMFRLGIRSLNGLRNAEATIQGFTEEDPRFTRAITLLGELWATGACSYRVLKGPSGGDAPGLAFAEEPPAEETRGKIQEVFELLGLDPAIREYRLVVGTHADPPELAVQTRALIHILGVLAAEVEVPAADIDEGRATRGVAQLADASQRSRALRIGSSVEAPSDPYVAVRHRGRYFYIDDRDLRSKRSFSLLMLLFSLADTGPQEPGPVLTIPAQ